MLPFTSIWAGTLCGPLSHFLSSFHRAGETPRIDQGLLVHLGAALTPSVQLAEVSPHNPHFEGRLLFSVIIELRAGWGWL
jgi:hypothetical protein